MCIIRLDGTLLDCNGAALKMLHAKNRDHLIGTPVGRESGRVGRGGREVVLIMLG